MRIGQVIVRPHECEPARFLAPSLEAFVSQVVSEVEAGKYLLIAGCLEERLTDGKEAGDQAKRSDEEQLSPGNRAIASNFSIGL